jgi:hypothetical protein
MSGKPRYGDQKRAKTGKGILCNQHSQTVIDVWCRSLKHCYLCAKIPHPSNDGCFLIPLVETLLLVMQRYPIEGFLIASNLSEKNYGVHAKLAGCGDIGLYSKQKKPWSLFLW